MVQVKYAASLAVFCVVLGTIAQAEAATYYVSTAGSDTSVGTEQQPFRTIRRGLSPLRPGDTLFIRSGVYAEQLFETDFRSTGVSWSSAITVAAYTGETVRLKPVTTQGNVARFQDGSVAYVVIKGLILDGLTAGGGGGGAVVYCGPSSHHLHFENVEIVNGDGNGALCSGSDHEFRHLKVHENGLSSSYANSNGMYMTTDRSSILGGEFYNNECFGVRFWDSAHPAATADDNVVRGARIYNNGLGVGLNGASACGSGGGGISLGDVNNRAVNNLVYGNYWGFSSTWTGASAIKVYNNTFYANRNGIEIGADTANADVRNNLLFQNGSAAIANASTSTTLSNNLTTDPRFVNAPIDFSLRAGSPAIDAGATLPGVVDDFVGTPRPTGAYDIGAYEFRNSVGVGPPASTGLPTLRSEN